MDFDLISAYSARVYWKADFDAAFVDFRGNNTNTKQESAKIQEGDVAFVIVNLEPSSTYSVRVSNKDGSQTLTNSFTTKDVASPSLGNLYEGIRRPDGVYDTTRFEKNVHDVFLENFSHIVNSGDVILAKVTVNGVPQEVETIAVRDGSSMKVDTNPNPNLGNADNNISKNLFLPFSADNTSSLQTVTLQHTDKQDVTLAYDREQNEFGYGGDMYGVGDKFELFGQMVTVADGSIVLLFSDTVAKTWPFDASKALSVVGAAGSHFMRNVTTNVLNLVGEKVDGKKGSTYNSAWVHNTTDSTTQEVSRMVHELDEASENATISIGVLHTDASTNQFIEPTLSMRYDATVISSQDETDATASATFTSTGLSFDTDAAAIYFGASKNFRMQFSDGTPSVLQIQSLDSGTGEYVTRQEFSDAS
ncbi:unnamed protein product [Sphacelaria rigidula]